VEEGGGEVDVAIRGIPFRARFDNTPCVTGDVAVASSDIFGPGLPGDWLGLLIVFLVLTPLAGAPQALRGWMDGL